ncbi:MAG: hypothetical protein DMF13_00930 [Verrucomicrobia bacterium]|nr:MAG: hypothetical protein DMF13_00930 [Verrucomicrobiota bacterium]
MAMPVRLNGWKLPHKAPESHYSPPKGTRKCKTSHFYSLHSQEHGLTGRGESHSLTTAGPNDLITD